MARRDSSFASLTRCASPPDPDVTQSDAHQHVELRADGRNGLEKLASFLDGHAEHVSNRLAAEPDLEGLPVVAPAPAGVALDVDIGEKVHLDAQQAISPAGLAAPALHIETEAPRQVAPRLRFRQSGKPLADGCEGAGIGSRIGPRGPADRRLVDVHHLVEHVGALECRVGSRRVVM